MTRSARIRNVEDAEREAYDEALSRQYRALHAAAHLAGYRFPAGNDSPMPYVCPTCAALVTISAVERHTEWHAALAS